MLQAGKIARAEYWYCPDLAQPVKLCGTQAMCAAEHGCTRVPTDCPLYVQFLIKTAAWHLGLSK